MKIICEMIVADFFKLSTGHIALVGKVRPTIESFIPASKADLYIGEKKIRTINIIGEDRFFGGDEEKRRDKRAIRTTDDISFDLNAKVNKEIKLIIYYS